MKGTVLIFGFLLTFCAFSKAQNTRVILKYDQKPVSDILKKLTWNDTLNFDVTGGSLKWINTLNWALADEGYLAAGIEKTSEDSLFEYYFINPGRCYNQIKIQLTDDLKSYETQLIQTGKSPFRPADLQKRVINIIQQLENRGYPYAMIESEVLLATDSSIEIKLSLYKGNYVVIDSIMVTGTASIHPAFLESYLGLAHGDPYQENKIKQIDALLDRLSTVRRTGNTRVVMLKNSAVIKVFIDKRSSDRFDGVVGFAPNSPQSGGEGILFTGEVNLELKNLFGRGIESNVNWRKYLAASQDLGLGFMYPYLFNTPLYFGVDGQITRFDSLFIDSRINWRAGIFRNGNRQWGILYGRQNSSLITSDTLAVRKSGRLPVNNPMEINTYGLNLKWNQLNNAVNPSAGFRLSGQVSIGVRNIKRDPAIDRVIFYSPQFPAGISIYDTLNKKNMRGEILMDHVFFIPIKKQATLAFRYLGNYLISDRVYQNELYRLGGFSTLQGFDERAIFANSFTMLRTEFRYLLNEESYAGIFVNAAAAENRSEMTGGITGFLYGAGAHFQINTGRSSLQLAYALGTSQGEAPALRNAKFHFGLINYLR